MKPVGMVIVNSRIEGITGRPSSPPFEGVLLLRPLDSDDLQGHLAGVRKWAPWGAVAWATHPDDRGNRLSNMEIYHKGRNPRGRETRRARCQKNPCNKPFYGSKETAIWDRSWLCGVGFSPWFCCHKVAATEWPTPHGQTDSAWRIVPHNHILLLRRALGLCELATTIGCATPTGTHVRRRTVDEARA